MLGCLRRHSIQTSSTADTERELCHRRAISRRAVWRPAAGAVDSLKDHLPCGWEHCSLKRKRARATLPNWISIRCPDTSFLVFFFPFHHTEKPVESRFVKSLALFVNTFISAPPHENKFLLNIDLICQTRGSLQKINDSDGNLIKKKFSSRHSFIRQSPWVGLEGTWRGEGAESRLTNSRQPLTFPAPMIFSAAYTESPHLEHFSAPPYFWANLEVFGFVVGLWGWTLWKGEERN